jgi:hypothetical protein
MKYQYVKDYFESNDLVSLLSDCKEMFEAIDTYRQKFISNVLIDGKDITEALTVLTGIYMFVEEAFSVAQAFKEIEEDKEYLRVRNDAISKGDKAPTDTTLKVTAHSAVAEYIKLRNIFEAYTVGCEKAISTCQTLLKRLSKDEYKTQE